MAIEHTYIFFKSRDELLRIEVSKIVYLESDGNYTVVVMVNKLRASILLNLGEMEKVLATQLGESANMFIRLGRRFIINMQYIHSVNVLKQHLIMSDYEHFTFQLPVSKEALKKMKELMVQDCQMSEML